MNAEADPAFETPEEGAGALLLDLDGFEGPLHLLLDLARTQKVDLAKISVAALADQYLSFINQALSQRIDLAADYLVMAAWLTFLKSRLLLPKAQEEAEEPDATTLEAHLRRRLEHLARARAAAERLWAMPQLNRDVFLFGRPQPVAITRAPVWQASLYDLLSAYGAHWTRVLAHKAHDVRPRAAYPIEAARKRLETLLERQMDEWSTIEKLAPPAEHGENAPPPASYIASLLGAALELARDGKLEMRQAEPFSALYLKAARGS
ncbi:MAG TPA: ScpA family protein [Caulobacterales bacterium]|nr:ScpA family protein [Caulobacterales bacterium]